MEPQRSRAGRVLLCLGGLVVLLVVVAVILNRVDGSEAFSLLPGAGGWAYVIVAAMVFGDAVFPVLPGETTLSAGTTLAAEGSLHLSLMVAAGALGAVVGDSTLYWIARLAKRRAQPQIQKAESDERVAVALAYMEGNAPLLIVAGRYVPGLRFVINATMGVEEFPYGRFLAWSALGGTLWSAYTCGLAYLISTALAGFPLASVVISGTVTAGAVALVIVRIRRASQ